MNNLDPVLVKPKISNMYNLLMQNNLAAALQGAFIMYELLSKGITSNVISIV